MICAPANDRTASAQAAWRGTARNARCCEPIDYTRLTGATQDAVRWMNQIQMPYTGRKHGKMITVST